MTDEIDPSEVLSAALRRAIDPSLILVALVGALGTVGLTMLTHAVGLVPIPGTRHALYNVGIAEATAAITLVASALVNGAMAAMLVARDRGERLSVGAALSRGLARLHLLYAAQFLATLSVSIGMVLVVVPGVYLAVLLAFVTPLVVVEGASPLTALRRCRELIAGRGAAVAGVVLGGWFLMAVAYLCCTLPVILVLPTPPGGMAGSFVAGLRHATSLDEPLLVVATVVARTAYGTIWAAITATLYLRLRAREQANEGERLAEVFR